MINNNIFTFDNPSPTGINWLTDHTGVFLAHTNIGIIAVDCPDNKSSKDVYLIDSGTDKNMATDIYNALTKEFPNFTLKAVIDSHSHADHAGGNAELVRRTGCKILATQHEKSSIETPELQSAVAYGAFPLPEYQIDYYHSEMSLVDQVIKSDELITINEQVSIQCIPLPGHYFDMIGLLVKDGNTNSFFTADGIFTRSMLAKYWIPFIFDVGSFKTSLETIKSINSDYYIPSHGDIYTEISALYELNMLSVLQNEQTIIGCLKEQQRTFEDILKYIADFNGMSMRLSQFMLVGFTIRSYITYLYTQEKITWVFKDNKMYWKIKEK